MGRRLCALDGAMGRSRKILVVLAGLLAAPVLVAGGTLAGCAALVPSAPHVCCAAPASQPACCDGAQVPRLEAAAGGLECGCTAAPATPEAPVPEAAPAPTGAGVACLERPVVAGTPAVAEGPRPAAPGCAQPPPQRPAFLLDCAFLI